MRAAGWGRCLMLWQRFPGQCSQEPGACNCAHRHVTCAKRVVEGLTKAVLPSRASKLRPPGMSTQHRSAMGKGDRKVLSRCVGHCPFTAGPLQPCMANRAVRCALRQLGPSRPPHVSTRRH